MGDLVDVLVARGDHQSQFSFAGVGGGLAVEQQLTLLVACGGAAALAPEGDRQSALAQLAGEAFQLRALAAAVEAFKGDELAARGTHAGDDTRVYGVTITVAGCYIQKFA